MEKVSSRPIWNGSISFGLVTIPVRLHTAVREKNLHFRTLHDQDHVPLKQKMYCPVDNKEVHPEHQVKGYEVEKDQFVIIRRDELEAAAPKASHAIEISDFVDLDEIDPIYFDRPYYVAPKPEGAKPFKLLLEAMQKKNKVGIARIVMHNKEYLAALRPVEDTLCLETMHFGDEVVSSEKLPELTVKAKVDDRELKIAEQLVDALTSKFDPKKYHDEYRERVLDIIQRKAKGERISVKPAPEDKPGRGSDLIAALEASLAKTKTAATTTAKAPARRRKSA